MPRLTNNEYLGNRLFLVDARSDFRGIYTALPFNHQIELHAFYRPFEELDEDQVLQHEPCIPHVAGKHLNVLLRVAKVAQRSAHQRRRNPIDFIAPVVRRKKHIVVRPLAKPEPDLNLPAEALLDFVESLSPEERHRLAAEYDEGRAA